MSRLIKLDKPIIVEGKYDKITLENIVDTLIIQTDGFRIFKDKDKCEMIKTLAKRFGVIVLTDSDSAGNMIRGYIKKIAGDCEIINVYIPRIKGKEKRKEKGGKEGVLGVEGMTADIINEAFEKCGVFGKTVAKKSRKITKCDLFVCGLSGKENSSENRISFLKYISLPENLSSNAMLDVLNTIFEYTEFCEVVKKWQSKETEN